MFKDLLCIALGGALGSCMRFGLSLLASVIHIPGIFATLAANILGSFLIGLIMALYSDNPTLFLFGTVGLCGGFTTFSTFSSQTLEMFQTGQYLVGFSYAAGSLLVCILSVALGMRVGNL